MKARPRLGKGIDALIPVDESVSSSQVIELALEAIRPNPIQPRKSIDQDKLYELAQSIKSHGLISPILVRKKHSTYEIIARERRYPACRIAGRPRCRSW
jgi:ParB family chromosome partitioning protein